MADRAASRAARESQRAPRRRGSRDAATRQRLLDVALRQFADRGFKSVTVRELCREADANVASVNYHFGDKLGLYREVVERALEGIREDATIVVAEGADPAERLRHYVCTLLPRLANPSGEAISVQKLMRQEMNDPTPLAPWIADIVVLPRIRFLSDAVAELMDTDVDDPRVRRCVVSLQAQCLFYMPNNFRKVAVPGWRDMTPEDIAAAAEHIAEFTLAGIERVAAA
ncbi:MAG: CerR family C-terminal domain-containing protein [Gemmatimonadota bacterium]